MTWQGHTHTLTAVDASVALVSTLLVHTHTLTAVHASVALVSSLLVHTHTPDSSPR